MKRLRQLLLIISFILVQHSCSNESTSDLIDGQNSEIVTYNQVVKGIMDNNCISCHGTTPTNGAPMSLTTYENVKDAVLNLGLQDRISREQGASGLMPESGVRLPQVKINQISTWASQGFQQ